MAASFSLRPQDSLWVGAHDARLTGDVVDETPGCKVDRADWSGVPDDLGDGVCPHHKLSLPYRALSSCPFAQVFKDDATEFEARKTGGGRVIRPGLSQGFLCVWNSIVTRSGQMIPAALEAAAKIRRASCSLGIGRLDSRGMGSSWALVRDISRTRASTMPSDGVSKGSPPRRPQFRPPGRGS